MDDSNRRPLKRNGRTVESQDRNVLRDLARRVAEYADRPIMSERRHLWRRHNRMERVRPVIFMDPQGSWCELLPPSALRCVDPEARAIETDLRRRLYVAEQFASDNVVEKEWVVRKAIHDSGWGLTPRRSPSPDERGAFGFSPVIQGPADLKKLRMPRVAYDEAATSQRHAFFQELFGDILNVRLKGIDDLSYHLMNQYTALRGLQEVLTDMLDNPGMVHDAMAFLEEGHRQLLSQYVEQNLLGLNNDNVPIYTSGHGYSDELPQPDYDGRVRPQDLWGWAEAQEMAVVSPAMHRKFAFSHEKRLLEPFGLNGYGCCDDVTRKLDFVMTVPHLRRVSVSPWANVDRCAERIRDRVIFMWKPQPAHLVGRFNPNAVRAYLRHTVAVARAHGCTLEIVLLDTHSCESHPERFAEWSRIAHEAVTN